MYQTYILLDILFVNRVTVNLVSVRSPNRNTWKGHLRQRSSLWWRRNAVQKTQRVKGLTSLNLCTVSDDEEGWGEIQVRGYTVCETFELRHVFCVQIPLWEIVSSHWQSAIFKTTREYYSLGLYHLVTIIRSLILLKSTRIFIQIASLFLCLQISRYDHN